MWLQDNNSYVFKIGILLRRKKPIQVFGHLYGIIQAGAKAKSIGIQLIQKKLSQRPERQIVGPLMPSFMYAPILLHDEKTPKSWHQEHMQKPEEVYVTAKSKRRDVVACK